MKNGVRYAFPGNVHDPAGQCTYCHNCQALLIGAQWLRDHGVAPERRMQLRHVPRPLRRRFQWLARHLGFQAYASRNECGAAAWQ